MKPTSCPTPIRSKAFLNKKINQLLPIACRRWTCPVCGPAKAHRLGHLAGLNGPERFITLSAASDSVRGAYEALRRLSRLLRRRGYIWEYLAVPERHQNGLYHLHLLQKGSFVPQKVLSQMAERSGMGRVVWIERIKGSEHGVNAAPKYLVKYMTKDPHHHPPNVNRYAQSRGFWGEGGRGAFERKAWGSSNTDWEMVHLGSAEIRGEGGSILWMVGSTTP
jgi:hypothetical protein